MFGGTSSGFCRFSLSLSVLWIILALLHVNDAVECKKTGACACQAGSNVINLKPLMDGRKAGDALFSNYSASLTTDTSKYSYSPCDPYFDLGPTPTGPQSSCHNVSACQQTKNNQYHCLGNTSDVTFSGDPEKNTLLITYKCNDPTKRILYVNLRCDRTTSFSVLGEQPPTNYTFTLTTPYACIQYQGITTGSILLILFFVAVILYLVLGVLFLRFARGARGVEQIPNFEFWKDFPSLVKDGAVFAIGGCKGDQTYEKI